MSVIAFDGKRIAADKQSTCAGLPVVTRKILKTEKAILAWTGDQEQGLALAEWFLNGKNKNDWPKFQSGENWTRLIVVENGIVGFYEKEPYMQTVDDKFTAWGSGRDYAIATMSLGFDAFKAVEVASQFDVYCGLGVDIYEIGV